MTVVVSKPGKATSHIYFVHDYVDLALNKLDMVALPRCVEDDTACMSK